MSAPRTPWLRGTLAGLGWLLVGTASLAQTFHGNSNLPLGSGPGASRQAWATAAALSRGIRWQNNGARPPGQAMDPLPPERLVDMLEKAGFRSVLLPLRLPPQPPAVDEPSSPTDTLIDLLLARGLNVVLEVHDDSPHDSALTLPALRQRYANGWRQVARRYAGRPERLLFEVALPPELPVRWKNALLAEAVTAVRPSHPQRVVVIGWQDALGLPALVLPDDAHLIVAIRNTEPFRFTHQGVPGLAQADTWRGTGCCNPQERQLMLLPLDVAKAWSLDHRYPVWLEQFMSYKAIPVELRAQHTRVMRDAAEARGLSWAYGAFSSDFGLYDDTLRRWQPPMLEALLGP